MIKTHIILIWIVHQTWDLSKNSHDRISGPKIRENLHSWHKFYTTVGHDGCDKSQPWFLSEPSPIIALHCLSFRKSVTPHFETWLMWPWRVKIFAPSSKVTQPLIALSAVVSFTAVLLTLEQNKSHVVDARTKQKTWCFWKQTKAMVFMPEQNKRHGFLCRNKTKAMLMFL